MPREITNAEITHVSYVDKPANGRKFFMLKSANVENEDITAEKVKTILQDKLKPIMERVDNLEKARIQKSIWSNLFQTEGYRFKE